MKIQPNKTLDVIILGQTFVDLCGQQIGSSLDEMLNFKKFVGGVPATVAISLSRLGLKSALITTVGKDPLGNFVLNTLRAEGVAAYVKTHQNPTPLCLTAIENKHIFPQLSYYLDKVEAPDEAYFSVIPKAQALVVECAENSSFQLSTKNAVALALENNTNVILILGSYTAEKYNFFQEIQKSCDFIIGSEKEFQAFAQTQQTYFALKQLRANTSAVIVLKQETGCFVFEQAIPEKWQVSSNHLIKVDNPYGLEGKAAFIAGFLKAQLQQGSVEASCQIANACSALVQSRQDNCAALPSEKELSLFLSANSPGQILKTTHFAHIHYASTHQSLSPQIYAFSFGYHSQWLKMGEIYHIDEAAISRAKLLIAEGLNLAQESTPFASVISDDHFQQDVVELFPKFQTLIRSVESANEVPLQFKSDPDVTRTLLQWPHHHIVKVSLAYHPDDRYVLRGQQEATLNLLYRSCRATDHEFLIEIAPPANSLITASTLAHIMNRFYEIGIYPDWWQIQPPRDQRSWDGITRTIDENDPYCRGVLIVGQQTTFDQLKAMLNTAAKQKYCRGFVIGRTIINQPLELWFAQKITDKDLTEMVAANFQKAVSIWHEINADTTHKIAEESIV